MARPSRGRQTHGKLTFCKLLLDLLAFHLAILAHLLVYINTFASVDSFAALLEQGISATKQVICSSNSLFVANDSWSRMVAMAANNARPCGDWRQHKKFLLFYMLLKWRFGK